MIQRVVDWIADNWPIVFGGGLLLGIAGIILLAEVFINERKLETRYYNGICVDVIVESLDGDITRIVGAYPCAQEAQ